MHNWKRLLTRDANILLKSLVIKGITHGPRFVLPEWPGVHNHFWSWNKGETGIHVLVEDLQRFSQAVLSAALADKTWVQRYRTRSKQKCDQAVAAITTLSEGDLTVLSAEQLQERFKKFCDLYSELAEVIVMTLEEIEGEIIPHLGNPNDLGTLITPPDLSIEAEEELARLELLKEINMHYKELFTLEKSIIEERLPQFPKLNRDLSEHVQKYGWIPLNFEKDLWSKSFFVGLLKKSLEEKLDYISRLKELRSFTDNRRREREQLLANLDERIQIIANLLEATAYIRLYRATIFSKAYYAAFPLLIEIGRRLGVPLNTLKYYTYQEIIKALGTHEQLSAARGKARKNNFAILVIDDDYHQYEGEEAQKIIAQESPPEQLVTTGELKGRCAYPGKVRGVVKIIADAHEMDKIQPGDILVCRETNPDLVIAMARAGAIVTDEGGITSHAAIVSREMRKPCIIGTGTATKLLHDGDLVEVDAEKAIVRKL